MYDPDSDGEDGPGDVTRSGVILGGGNVFDPYGGEAAIGTARLFDIIRFDIEDRYGWPCIWLAVAPPYWLACACESQSCALGTRGARPSALLTGERICLEMCRIVSLESVWTLICGRLDITGPPWR
jgi:hypothetical protein